LLIRVVDLVFWGLSIANGEFFRSGSMTIGWVLSVLILFWKWQPDEHSIRMSFFSKCEPDEGVIWLSFFLQITIGWHAHPVHIFSIFFVKLTLTLCTVIDMVKENVTLSTIKLFTFFLYLIFLKLNGIKLWLCYMCCHLSSPE